MRLIKGALQRQPPRKPHKPNSMRMGARKFCDFGGFSPQYKWQINRKDEYFVDGVPYDKWISQ